MALRQQRSWGILVSVGSLYQLWFGLADGSHSVNSEDKRFNRELGMGDWLIHSKYSSGMR